MGSVPDGLDEISNSNHDSILDPDESCTNYSSDDFPHSSGPTPDLTGLAPLVRQVGYARALEVCVRARNIDAQEAGTLGLAYSVVPVADLTSEVDAFVESVLRADTEAVRETKRLLQSAEVFDLEHQRVLESAAQVRRLRALASGQTESDGQRF